MTVQEGPDNGSLDALRADGLCVKYGAATALDDVSIRVGNGEVVALLGSNGAGKSTLLNALTGVVSVAAGSMSLHGRSIVGCHPWQLLAAGLAHVPEGRQVFPDMTVEEHLTIVPQRETVVPVTADDVFDMFPRLAERRRQAAGNLSGGEQQMLVIGRALRAQPSVLLLDEPSLGLSPKLAGEVISTVGQLQARGVSILLVEQNASLALSVAQRIYVLATGRVVASGESEEVAQSDVIRKAYLG